MFLDCPQWGVLTTSIINFTTLTRNSTTLELSDELIEADAMIEEAQSLMVKARMLEILNGESLRRFQQAVITVARQVG